MIITSIFSFSGWINCDNIYDYSQNKIKFDTKNKSKNFKNAVREADEAILKQNQPLVDSPTSSGSKSEIGAVMLIPPSSSIKKISLKTIVINDLLKTFDENKAALQAIFNERRTNPDRFNRGNGMDYLTI